MGDIFLKDEIPHQGPQWRSINDIKQILYRIKSVPPSYVRLVPTGYMIGFTQEKDVNHMIDDDTYNKLKLVHLTVDLAKTTKESREIVIVDIPDYLYNDSDAVICNDLQQKNSLRIIKFIKYISPYSQRRIIKAIVDSNLSHANVVQRGKIKLGHSILNLRNSTRASQATSNTQSQPQANLSYSMPRAQPNDQFLSRHSNWGIHQNLQNPNTNHINNRPVSLRPQYSDIDRKFHLDSFQSICAHLSTGPENPELFVRQYNLMLHHYGYSVIDIPDELI